MKITTVGIDIAKSIFHVFAVNKMGTLVKKKQLKRKELITFIAQLEPCGSRWRPVEVHTIGRASFRSLSTK